MKKISVNNKNNLFIINTLLILIFVFYLLAYCNKNLYLILSKFSNILLLVLYALIFISLNNNKENKKYFLYITLVIIIIAIGTACTTFGLGSLINIVNMFLFVLSVDKIKLSRGFVNISKYIVPIFYILFIFSDHSFLNTNYVGYIFLLYFMLFNNLYNLSDKKFYKLIINIVLLALTLYFGNLYQCRTSQIVAIFIFVVQHLNKKIYSSNTLKKFLPYLLTVGSLVVAFFYVYMWKNNLSIDLTSFADKRLYSGRNLIWNECFELIKNSPIFGVGGNYALNSHFTYALHNSMMMVVTTYGIPIFVIFVGCFKNFIYSIYEKYSSNKNFYLIIVSLFSIFFVDYFESYFYWSVFNFMSLIIISLSIYKVDGDCNEKK